MALVSIPAGYALGFLSWSFYARLQGLGYLPLFHAQYLISGFASILLWMFLPASFAIGVGIVFVFRYHLQAPHSKKRGTAWFLGLFAAAGFLATAAIYVWQWRIVFTNPSPGALAAGFGLISLAGGLWLAWVAKPGRWWAPFAFSVSGRPSRIDFGPLLKRTTTGPVSVIMWPVMLLLVFPAVGGTLLVPHMHASFGGGTPRCAWLDVDPADVSPITRLTLFGPNDPGEGVQQSNLIWVYFAGPDSLLMRPDVFNDRSDPVTSIEHSVIQATMWCQDVPPLSL